jgi:hypothetical protein
MTKYAISYGIYLMTLICLYRRTAGLRRALSYLGPTLRQRRMPSSSASHATASSTMPTTQELSSSLPTWSSLLNGRRLIKPAGRKRSRMARISAEVHPQLLHIRLTRWNKPGLTQTQLAGYIVLSFWTRLLPLTFRNLCATRSLNAVPG